MSHQCGPVFSSYNSTFDIESHCFRMPRTRSSPSSQPSVPLTSLPRSSPSTRISSSSAHSSSLPASARVPALSAAPSRQPASSADSPPPPPAWALNLTRLVEHQQVQLQSTQDEIRELRAASATAPEARQSKPSFVSKGCEQQFDLNNEVLATMERATRQVGAGRHQDAVDSLQQGMQILTKRNKLLRIADKKGWDTVAEYIGDDFADDDEDARKIRRAEVEATKKRKDRGSRRSPPPRYNPYPNGATPEGSPGRGHFAGGVTSHSVPPLLTAATTAESVATGAIGRETVASHPILGQRTDPDASSQPDKLPVVACSFLSNEFNSRTCMSDPSELCGRLRRNISFWDSIGVSSFARSVILNGYYLPLSSLPPTTSFRNHSSAVKHAEFVCNAIEDLIAKGSVSRVDASFVHLCSPLGVVAQPNKLRLILDLRFLNDHLTLKKFKYEDIRSAMALFEKGDFFFTFDLASAYHHIDVDPRYWKFLGFTWPTPDGQSQSYVFKSLPLGLASAPYVFTKVTRDLVHHWRRQGIKCMMYLDDGAACDASEQRCNEISVQVRQDLLSAGFILSDKSRFQPARSGTLLGFDLDLSSGFIFVTERRVAKLRNLVDSLVSATSATARDVARLVGTIISMGPALGKVTRLRSRSLYEAINAASHFDELVHLPPRARAEILFWSSSFDQFNGRPLKPLRQDTAVFTWSDASDFGWDGFVINRNGSSLARGRLPDVQQGPHTSSTFRELLATQRVLESVTNQVKGCQVIHRTDNQAAVAILESGSRHPHLHDVATAIFQFCLQHSIQLSAEWIPRSENDRADYLSKLDDSDDWMLSPAIFCRINSLWGPHTIDRFASPENNQLPRFCSRWWNPTCVTVDAFTVLWSGETNWVYPPIYLIARCIHHFLFSKADGTLVIPFWQSAIWWPLLVDDTRIFRAFVRDTLLLQPHRDMFKSGHCKWNFFTSKIPRCEVIAIRICACGKHQRQRVPVPLC